MELNTFIEKYKGWLASTGVTAVPEITKAEFTPVVGYTPATYILWTDSLGSTLRQSAEVLASSESPEYGLRQVRAFFNLEPFVGNTKEAWERYLNPPAEIVPEVLKMGAPVPAETVAAFAPSGRVSTSRKYFLQGKLSIPDGQFHQAGGKTYMAVRPTPFVSWLMEL